MVEKYHGGMVRNVSDAVGASVFYESWLYSRQVETTLDTIISEWAISADELALLTTLRVMELPIHEVCRRTNIKKSTVSMMYRRLESVGLLEQQQNPADGRSKLLSLTQKGYDVFDEIGARITEAERTFYIENQIDHQRLIAQFVSLREALKALPGILESRASGE